jgi:pyruvate dehydrogenase E2 component (dihydrolipoamide acetyltransferase)
MWWFAKPANPYVVINFVVDFTNARAWLAQVRARTGVHVSVQHLLAGAVGRTLAAFPLANAQIIRGRIVLRDKVGIAMPVNLLGHEGGAKRELGAMLVEDAGRSSVAALAEASARAASKERTGASTNPLIGAFTRIGERAPRRAVFAAMDGFEAVRELPLVSRLVYRAAPATTLLSNVGGPLGELQGALFRGGAVHPPPRLAHVGTVWGSSAVQDEVVVVDGAPAVRPMLPVLLVFDHRLVDGVVGGRMAKHFTRILQDPASVFGEDARTTG